MDKKFELLRKIAHEFNQAGITWALGASMFLYLKGISPEFDDIDLMIADKDIESAKEILMNMGELLSAKSNYGYATKAFYEFAIDGIEVDFMAGFAVVKDGIQHDCSLEADPAVEVYELEGEKVPFQSLEAWCRYYEWMGRDGKVRMIREKSKVDG